MGLDPIRGVKLGNLSDHVGNEQFAAASCGTAYEGHSDVRPILPINYPIN